MSAQASTQELRPQRLLLHTVETRLAGKPVREYRLRSETTSDRERRLSYAYDALGSLLSRRDSAGGGMSTSGYGEGPSARTPPATPPWAASGGSSCTTRWGG